MKALTKKVHLLAAFASLSLFAIVHAAPSSTDEGEDQIKRWKPQYKPYARQATQRQRRTGRVSEEFMEESKEQWAEPETQAEEQVRPRGYLKSKEDEEKKSGGILKKVWPFKKNSEAEGIGKPMPAATAPAAASEAVSEADSQMRDGKERRGFFGALKRFIPGKSKSGMEESREERKARKIEKDMADAEQEMGEEKAKQEEMQAEKREMTIKEVEKRLSVPVKPVALPRETPASYVKGKTYYDQGEYTKAIQNFGDFIASDELTDNPLVAPARYYIAKSFEQLEQLDVAKSLYKQIQQEHEDSQFWAGLAGIELASLRGGSAMTEATDGSWDAVPGGDVKATKPAKTVTIPGDDTVIPDEGEAPGVLPEDVVNTTIPGDDTPPAEAAPGGAPSEAPSAAPSFAPGGAPGQ